MALIHDCNPKATNAVSDLGLSWPTGTKSLFTHPRRRLERWCTVRNRRGPDVNEEWLLVVLPSHRGLGRKRRCRRKIVARAKGKTLCRNAEPLPMLASGRVALIRI